jgi:hypothetical protein
MIFIRELYISKKFYAIEKVNTYMRKFLLRARNRVIVIPKPVWAVGFALEQTLHVVAITVFSYVDFKVASTYYT